MAYFISYGGLVYDLTVGLLLMWHRTFWIGIALTLIFHISNKLIFNIGIFPYVMIASTSLYFNPDWPRKLYYKIRKKPFTPVADTKTEFSSYLPPKNRKLSAFQCFVLLIALLFLVWWVLMPIRFLWMPGPQVWNENGHMVCFFSICCWFLLCLF